MALIACEFGVSPSGLVTKIPAIPHMCGGHSSSIVAKETLGGFNDQVQKVKRDAV